MTLGSGLSVLGIIRCIDFQTVTKLLASFFSSIVVKKLFVRHFGDVLTYHIHRCIPRDRDTGGGGPAVKKLFVLLIMIDGTLL